MENKYNWIAVQYQMHDCKLYAVAVRVPHNRNMINAFGSSAIVAQICSSKKDAVDLVTAWNEQFQKNGTYAYGDWRKYDLIGEL